MARATLSAFLESVQGSIGDLVVRQYGTKFVLSRKPVFRNRTFTAAQKACQENFREAALFARRNMEDPRSRTMYEEEARALGKPVRSVIIADFLRARVQQGCATVKKIEATKPEHHPAVTIMEHHDLPDGTSEEILKPVQRHEGSANPTVAPANNPCGASVVWDRKKLLGSPLVSF